MPEPPGSSLPALVGGYQVVRELARGGMGMVLEARDPALERRVAIKLLLEHRHSDVAQRRFQVEAESLARLRHPHIVGVHASGYDAGRAYLVMDFVEGQTLEQRLRAGPLTNQEAAQLALLLAEALEHAHAQGVIHRDLKPANVLLTPDGAPKLTDFGLALQLGEAGLSRTGQLIGTPGFWAPEQLGSDRSAIGPAADVYGLGATLFCALTGRPPFVGEHLAELVEQAMRQGAPAPSSLRPEVDPRLDAICARCLAKSPAQRYPSARALADDLRAYLAGAPTGARPRWVGAALVAVGALIAGGAWGLHRRATPAPPAASLPPSTTTPTPASSASAQTADDPPAWIGEWPPAQRPPWPLPAGLRVGDEPGEFVWERGDHVLVWIPPGVATLGLPVERARAPEQVEFPRGFFLGKLEVTREQFLAHCRREALPAPPDPVSSVWGELADDWPIVNVTWEQARDFCRAQGLRLPTTDEWEYAARGHTGAAYPWGDAPTPGRANLEGDADGFSGIAPVGSCPDDRSPFGCLDLVGNVVEWSLDGPAGGGAARWNRGGHYLSALQPVAIRGSTQGDTFGEHKGFRVALPLD